MKRRYVGRSEQGGGSSDSSTRIWIKGEIAVQVESEGIKEERRSRGRVVSRKISGDMS